MDFRTIIPIKKSQNPIDYNSQLLLLGSCFAENVGAKFDYFKFQVTTNPFGIIFNPVSTEKLIYRIVNQQVFTEKDIFFHNDLWHCYEVHSKVSNPHKEEFLLKLNEILAVTHAQILACSHLMLTYGTSWVYRNIKSNKIVANCHKVPQKEFTKELLSIETIEIALKNTIDLIKKVNPKCNFIFTISPVRHIKDGFVENQRGKSHLISSLQGFLQTEHYKLNTEYFPSFEIMMDELRDYRFYTQDMLHPNQVAIEYIWERFFENYIAETEFQLMQEIESIQKSLRHKPFNLNAASHQYFLKNLDQKIFKIKQILPHLQF
jgi:hypothetical protein